MTNTKLWTLLLLAALIISLTSCFDTISYSDKGTITEFYIPDQSGAILVSDIEFTITDPATEEDYGLITNIDSLFPYGSLNDSLIPVFTTDGAAYTLWKTTYVTDSGEVRDTAYYVYSSTSNIDFADTAHLIVVSEDGEHVTYYDVVINVDQIYPGSVSWEQLSDSIPTGLTEYSESFYLNGKLFVLSGDINPETDEVYTNLSSSVDGKTWNKVNLQTDFPKGIYHTVKVFSNTAYIIGYVGWNSGSHIFTANEEIWSSTDGTTWSKADYPTGMHSVFKNANVFNNELVVWGGSSINASASTVEDMPYTSSGEVPDPDYSAWYFDGSEWTQGASIPSEMAVRFSTSCLYEDHGQIYGGELADGTNSNLFWSLEDDNYWVNFPVSELEALSKATMISFDRNLWIFGGINDEGVTNYTIQVSKDGGLTFQSIYELEEDNMAPGLAYIMRANQQVIMTPDHTVYVIGGENSEFATVVNGDTNEQIVRTNKLYDVWRGKMRKYSN